jgi:hypothetical protein
MPERALPVLGIDAIHHDTRRLEYKLNPLGMTDPNRVHEASAEE